VRRQVMAGLKLAAAMKAPTSACRSRPNSPAPHRGLGASAKPRDDRLGGGSTLYGVFKGLPGSFGHLATADTAMIAVSRPYVESTIG